MAYLCARTKNENESKDQHFARSCLRQSIDFVSVFVLAHEHYVGLPIIFCSKATNSTGNFGPIGRCTPILSDVGVYHTTLQELQLQSSFNMVRYAWMALKIDVHSAFSTKSPLDFVALYQKFWSKTYLGSPIQQA